MFLSRCTDMCIQYKFNKIIGELNTTHTYYRGLNRNYTLSTVSIAAMPRISVTHEMPRLISRYTSNQ